VLGAVGGQAGAIATPDRPLESQRAALLEEQKRLAGEVERLIEASTPREEAAPAVADDPTEAAPEQVAPVEPTLVTGYGSSSVVTDWSDDQRQAKHDQALRHIQRSSKQHADAELVDVDTAESREALRVADKFGVDLVFVGNMPESRGVAIVDHDVDGKIAPTGILAIRSDLEGDALWEILGHELAHGTGVDLKGILPESEQVEIWDNFLNQFDPETDYGRERRRWNEERAERDPEFSRREAVARYVGELFTDTAFRSRAISENRGTVSKVVDAVFDLVGRLGFDIAPSKYKALSELRDSLREVPEAAPTPTPTPTAPAPEPVTPDVAPAPTGEEGADRFPDFFIRAEEPAPPGAPAFVEDVRLPKQTSTDEYGRPHYEWRGAQVFHYTPDDESVKSITEDGYKIVGDGYYGEAISFTNNEKYAQSFGGKRTVAQLADDIIVVELGDSRFDELTRGASQTTGKRARAMGIDALYDSGAGDLFVFNQAKISPALATPADPDVLAAEETTPPVDTPEFKRWFGKSKVVDEDGSPLVVHHGSTQKGLTQFDTRKTVEVPNAFFFSSDEGVAYEYTFERAYGDIIGDEPLGDVIPSYLSLQNPLEYVPGNVHGVSKPDQKIVDAVEMGLAIDMAKSKGHDGLVIRNIDDTVGGSGNLSDVYVAFSPTQIKSATANVGTFDPADPSILAAEEPAPTAVTPEQDRKYMAAVEAGDTKTAQRMVDEAAKKAGYGVGPVYHGTKQKFHVFEHRRDPSELFYFSFSEDFAKDYARGTGGHRVPPPEISRRIDKVREESRSYTDKLFEQDAKKHGEFDLNKPGALERYDAIFEKQKNFERKRLDGMTVADASMEMGINVIKGYIKAPNLFDPRKHWKKYLPELETAVGAKKENWLPQVRDVVENGGYLIWESRDVVDAVLEDYDGMLIQESTGEPPNTVAVRNPSQIKSADPITRDDAGNVIPISQRFQADDPSILFAEEPAPRVDTTESVASALEDDVYRELNDNPGITPVRAVDNVIAKLNINMTNPGNVEKVFDVRQALLAKVAEQAKTAGDEEKKDKPVTRKKAKAEDKDDKDPEVPPVSIPENASVSQTASTIKAILPSGVSRALQDDFMKAMGFDSFVPSPTRQSQIEALVRAKNANRMKHMDDYAIEIISNPDAAPALDVDDQATMLLRQLELSHRHNEIQSELSKLSPKSPGYAELGAEIELNQVKIRNIRSALQFGRSALGRGLSFGNFDYNNYSKDNLTKRMQTAVNRNRKVDGPPVELTVDQEQAIEDHVKAEENVRQKLRKNEDEQHLQVASDSVSGRAKSKKPKGKQPKYESMRTKDTKGKTSSQLLANLAGRYKKTGKQCGL
jgi:hypothetical protein